MSDVTTIEVAFKLVKGVCVVKVFDLKKINFKGQKRQITVSWVRSKTTKREFQDEMNALHGITRALIFW